MNRNLFKNKSQIGIFIIIATIIILIGVYFFTFGGNSFHFFKDQTSSYKIQEYMKTCLDFETKTAVNKIGLHGGWLYAPPMIYANKDTSEFLVKSAKGYDEFGIKIPYWYYYDDLNKVFKFNIPPFDSFSPFSIRNQIKKYIDDNLENDCIQGFQSFKNVYDITYKPNKINTSVIFRNNQIIVDLNLPIKISKKNQNSSEYIDFFEVRNDNQLLVPYYLARDIAYSESKNSFLEKRTLQFLTPYMDTKRRDLLPPFYDFKLAFDFKPWRVKDVEKVLKEIINSNIDLLQFYGTSTKTRSLPNELKDNQFAIGIYNKYNKDYISKNSLIKKKEPELFKRYKQYNVETSFEPFYPMDFKLSPSLGNIILMPKPKAVISLLPIFFTTYTAVYEMHMPFLFKIKDTHNPNSKFSFNIAVEANIDHNTPLKENKHYGFNLNSLPSTGKSLVCDPYQFISKNVYLNISDPMDHGLRKDFYNDPIKGVDGAYVSFDCKGISTCFIGETKINGLYIQKNLTRLKFKLPINCNPGKLEVYKPGYKKILIKNINPNLKNSINLGERNLYSSKTMKVDVKILEEKKSRFSSGRTLNKYEYGFIVMKNLEDSDLTKVVKFDSNNQNNLSIDLFPGNYSVEGFVLFNHNFTIAPKEFCYSKGMFSSKKCQKIPGFKADSWLTGNLELKRFNIDFKDLFYNKRLVINIINIDVPSTYDDMKKYVKNIAQASLSKKPYFEKN